MPRADQAVQTFVGPHWDAIVSDGLRWRINGRFASERVVEELREGLATCSAQYASCPYCGSSLTDASYERDPETGSIRGVATSYLLQVCSRCSFWSWFSAESIHACMGDSLIVAASSVQRKFRASLPDGCEQEMAQVLRSCPDRWHDLEPRAFERLVAEIFRANHQNAEVMHVGKPGDGGVDVVLVDDNKDQWLIQAKCRTQSGVSEGFETLQRLLGTMFLEQCPRGVIVSTADYFTSKAEASAKRARTLVAHIELYDKGKLDRLLGPLLPRSPWEGLLSKRSFWHVDEDVRKSLQQQLPAPDGPLSLSDPLGKPA